MRTHHYVRISWSRQLKVCFHGRIVMTDTKRRFPLENMQSLINCGDHGTFGYVLCETSVTG